MAFELTDREKDLVEQSQIIEITQSMLWGQGATIIIAGLDTSKGKLTVKRILTGVEAGLDGTDITLEAAVQEVTPSQSIGKFIRRVGRGALATGGLTVRAVKNKALWSKLFLLNAARAVGVGIEGGRREREEGGDVFDVVAGTLIGFASGITLLDLVLPIGQDIATRSPEGNLIIPGGLEGFATAQSVTSVLAEAIRLVVFDNPIGGFFF